MSYSDATWADRFRGAEAALAEHREALQRLADAVMHADQVAIEEAIERAFAVLAERDRTGTTNPKGAP